MNIGMTQLDRPIGQNGVRIQIKTRFSLDFTSKCNAEQTQIIGHAKKMSNRSCEHTTNELNKLGERSLKCRNLRPACEMKWRINKIRIAVHFSEHNYCRSTKAHRNYWKDDRLIDWLKEDSTLRWTQNKSKQIGHRTRRWIMKEECNV